MVVFMAEKSNDNKNTFTKHGDKHIFGKFSITPKMGT
jgi:hypothetical protein